jgi:serine/threonine-protein kinase RsbW
VSASKNADPRREIHHRIPADAHKLAELRHALTSWANAAGMPGEQQEEFVLATYEAMANSVEHAYQDRADGILDLHVNRDPDGTVMVTVTDYGQWKTPVPSDGIRGRGIPLMKALARDTTIIRRDSGTTVTMTWTMRNA